MQKAFGYIAMGFVTLVIIAQAFGSGDAKKSFWSSWFSDDDKPDSTLTKPKSPTLVIPSTSSVLFQDEMDNNDHKWKLREEVNRSYSFLDGRYVMDNRSKDMYYWSTMETAGLADSLNFVIEAKLRKVSGIENNTFGLIWGYKDEQFYTFGITGDGQYRISHFNKGDWETLQGLTDAKAIRKKNEWNKLAVLKRGFKAYFYVNDVPVDTLNYKTMYGSAIGFGLNNSMKIEVESVSVRKL